MEWNNILGADSLEISLCLRASVAKKVFDEHRRTSKRKWG